MIGTGTLKLILESTEEGIFGLNTDGNITFINPSAARMLGYEASELIGRNSHETWHHTRVDGTHYPVEECLVYKSMLNGSACKGEEHFIRKDGSIFYTDFTSTPARKRLGKIIGAVVVFRDVTERRQAENEKEKLILTLRGAIADIKTLSGIIPICAYCKKIRDDKGYWQQVADYISKHTEVQFSHGICPECLAEARKELNMLLEQKDR